MRFAHGSAPRPASRPASASNPDRHPPGPRTSVHHVDFAQDHSLPSPAPLGPSRHRAAASGDRRARGKGRGAHRGSPRPRAKASVGGRARTTPRGRLRAERMAGTRRRPSAAGDAPARRSRPRLRRHLALRRAPSRVDGLHDPCSASRRRHARVSVVSIPLADECDARVRIGKSAEPSRACRSHISARFMQRQQKYSAPETLSYPRSGRSDP